MQLLHVVHSCLIFCLIILFIICLFPTPRQISIRAPSTQYNQMFGIKSFPPKRDARDHSCSISTFYFTKWLIVENLAKLYSTIYNIATIYVKLKRIAQELSWSRLTTACVSRHDQKSSVKYRAKKALPYINHEIWKRNSPSNFYIYSIIPITRTPDNPNSR